MSPPLRVRIAVLLLFAVGAWAGSSPTGYAQEDASSDRPPNIVLFLVDDLGWQDTSVPFHTVRTPFNDVYRTPGVAQLADQGVLFTNAYAASPVCTPTRTSIMTGRHPARTHITDWTLRPDVEKQRRTRPSLSVTAPDWNVRGLQPADTTLPALLQEGGYRTIHVGKAHFGALGTPGADPTTLGFDVNIAGHAAGAPGSYHSEEKYGNDEDGPWGVPGLEQYYGTDTYLTRALTYEAAEAIRAAVRDEEPFFLNMAHYAVHAPIMADSQYVDHYVGTNATEAAYASMVEGYDASLRALLWTLEDLGVADRTLVLFTSDNGGLSAHSRGQTPMGTGLNTHNLPLRSGKGSAYEGGVRVPMIVAWAKRDPSQPVQKRLPIAPGARTDAPVTSHDLFPSILTVAGVPRPAGYELDGRSFVPLLGSPQASDTAQDTTHFWHYPHLWGPRGPGLKPFTAARVGDWKLIYFYDEGRYELYNLADDLGETTNLVEAQPAVARRLANRMRAWMQRVGAQPPVDRVTGQSVGRPPLPE
ncbi:MAG: sulfatase [Salinibacter sp.]